MTTAQQIMREVSTKHFISIPKMKSPSRVQDVCRARGEAICRIRKELGKSYPWIGAYFNRDHTAIMYVIKKHNSQSPTPQQEHARHKHLSRSDYGCDANIGSAGRRVLEKERMK
ncbi:MAG: hypothetical protein COA43_11085 [Robiginitomaculum sp.]|nr:MAG: hypothetical protein COA43_11085 [Robiginitomaculum sp.]